MLVYSNFSFDKIRFNSLVEYPFSSDILQHSLLNSKIVNIFGTFSKTNNIEFINFFPLFMNENDDEKKRYNTIKKYYFYEDTHFNKKGNRLIADYFLNYYKNL